MRRWIAVMMSFFLVCGFLLNGAFAEGRIVLPENIASIGEEAFEGCASVQDVFLPAGLEELGDFALDGTGQPLWVHCAQGDIARALLRDGVDVDANTVCRALIIGQSYKGTSLALKGPANDARALKSCLIALKYLQYRIYSKSDLTAEEMKEAIREAFSQATEYDISILCYSGHGAEDGSLIGVDRSMLTPRELRSAMDGVPGRKVLILDACFSGAVLEEVEARAEQGPEENVVSMGTEFMEGKLSLMSTLPKLFQADEPTSGTSMDIQSFNSSLLDAFSDHVGSRRTLGLMAASGSFSQYYIMTSARKDEYSEEGPISSGTASRVMGYFTYFLCKGCGWDGVRRAPTECYADADQDGVVSFGEAFAYAAREAKSYNAEQDARTNAAGCNTFSPFR